MMLLKSRKFLLTATSLVFALLTGCDTQRSFDLEKWRSVNDTTLAPYQRHDKLSDLLSERSLNGLSKARVIELLGTPSYEVHTTSSGGVLSLNPNGTVSDSLFFGIMNELRAKDSVHSLTLTVVLSRDSTVKKTLVTYSSAVVR